MCKDKTRDFRVQVNSSRKYSTKNLRKEEVGPRESVLQFQAALTHRDIVGQIQHNSSRQEETGCRGDSEARGGWKCAQSRKE